MKTEKATFGAGCFWGVEETFRKLKGVVSTAVGYAGGTKDNPSYEDVCTDETGHAEVVEVEFDPSQINYNQLLDVFWSNHNPTTLNRQGSRCWKTISIRDLLSFAGAKSGRRILERRAGKEQAFQSANRDANRSRRRNSGGRKNIINAILRSAVSRIAQFEQIRTVISEP